MEVGSQIFFRFLTSDLLMLTEDIEAFDSLPNMFASWQRL
jgi:hypothetical protein